MATRLGKLGTRRLPRAWQAAALATAIAAIAAPARPQLDDSCFIAALNRTARVAEDGSWVLGNVPSTFGQLRLRATCVENGIQRAGQSDFFTIPPFGEVRIPEIVFDAPQPIPARLELTAPSTLLTSQGETVQLTVTATLADGSTVDLTAAASGTDYRSSNPRFATVGADGLVTAQASGTALLNATNEGTVAILPLQILLSGDSDGDGLPDDFEIANGLDPNDPVDALEDPDLDGLSTIDEFLAGLDPFDSDSDDDGLLDGEEVNVVGSNPLLFDTDGDQLGDGLEVLTGSDPLDPTSFNLAAALDSIAVAPDLFFVVVNEVEGEGSRQLQVTGNLIDGNAIDITEGYGTTYASDNPLVAFFGVDEGRVFGGQTGSTSLTIDNSGHAASALVAVERFSPTALSFVLIPGFANSVDLDGDHAYVAAGSAGLQIVDVLDLLNPFIAAALDTDGNANDAVVSDGLVYLADGAQGLKIIDVTIPTSPALLGSATTPGVATDLAVAGDRAYVADELGLRVFDVSDPATPVLLGGVDTPGRARGVELADGSAIVADSTAGLQVIDVSDPAGPVIVGATPTRFTGTSRAADLAVRGNLAFVADGAGAVLGSLRAIDVSLPSSPALVASSDDRLGLTGVALEGDLALASDYLAFNAVQIFGIGDTAPMLRAILDFRSSGRDDNGNDIDVRDGVAYLVGTRGQIRDNGISGTGALHIGRFAMFDDPTGLPPTVSLVTPQDGDEVEERDFLFVAARAEDDIRVASVRFEVDGETVDTDFAADRFGRHSTRILVEPGTTQLTLGAAALDFEGNQAVAEPVVLTVQPNAAPTARIIAPLPDASAKEGTEIAFVVDATDDLGPPLVEFYVDGVLVKSDSSPPYSTQVAVPFGVPSIELSIEVRDNQGLGTPPDPVTVTVEPNEPPFAAILEPTDGSEVVEGSRIRIVAGASDDLGVQSVAFFADGVEIGTTSAAPYQAFYEVPSSALPINLTAVARDIDLQEAAAEPVTLTVILDPLTTVEGKLLDLARSPVLAAEVECFELAGSTGVDGTFSIPGVPSLLGNVRCRSEFVTAEGQILTALSQSVATVPAGVTDVGEVVTSLELLYGVVAPGAPGNEGSLFYLDRLTGYSSKVGDVLTPGGLTGMAFDARGALFVTTLDLAAPTPTSDLLEVHPDTGAPLATIGPVVDGAAGTAMSVEDLALQPGSDVLFALRSGLDGTGNDGKLYTVARATGVATLVGNAGVGIRGIAFTPSGDLYALVDLGLESVAGLLQLSPETAAIISDQLLISEALGGGLRGLAAGPDELLFTYDESSEQVFTIDPGSGEITDLGQPRSGTLADLAFRDPLPPDKLTTVVGTVVEGEDELLPVADATVSVLGSYLGVSRVDGTFTIAGVPAVVGGLRLTASGPEGSTGELEDPVPPVPGGITDVGNIVLVPPGEF